MHIPACFEAKEGVSSENWLGLQIQKDLITVLTALEEMVDHRSGPARGLGATKITWAAQLLHRPRAISLTTSMRACVEFGEQLHSVFENSCV